MYLPLLLVYFTLSVAKRDINEDFHTNPPENINEGLSGREKEKIVMKERENDTSCEEFLNNTKFDIKRVIDVDWNAFYYWVDAYKIDRPPHVMTFKLPDVTVAQRFRQVLGSEAHRVNWTAAELFMESNLDISVLLLATNQSGRYDFAPSIPFEAKEKLKDDLDYHIALKFIEPHYLGFMNCRYRQLLAMAPAGKMPTDEEAVAKLFKFRSSLGLSLSEVNKMLEKKSPRQPAANEIEDDREMDVTYDDPTAVISVL